MHSMNNFNRTTIIMFLFIAIVHEFGVAQQASSFFPHQVGDLWQYRYTAFGVLAWTERLDSMFVDTSGIQFIRYNRLYHDGNYTRIGWYAIRDSNLVFEDQLPRQPDSLISQLLYKLDAQVGEAWIVRWEGGPPWAQVAKIITVDSVLLFGRHLACKEIDYGITMHGSNDTTWWSTRKLANEFGLINAQLEPMGPVYLAGAIIDGVQFGYIVSVSEYPAVPDAFILHQNFPNPFNPSTTIQFSVPTRSRIKLAVYDMLGRQVRTLVDKIFEEGTHSVVWDASLHSSGVYLCRLQAEQVILTRKMLFEK